MANETVIIAMPKVVGKVDLSKFEKKKKVEPIVAESQPEKKEVKANFHQWGSFPLALYDKVFALAVEASRKIGEKAIVTVSKTAKIKVNKPGGKYAFEEVKDRGSIWYGCTVNDLKKHFLLPLHILELAHKNKIQKLTANQFKQLAHDTEFYFMYVNAKGKIDIIKNVRVDGGEYEKDGVCYRGSNQTAVYCLSFSDIQDDTFKTGVEGEIGYMYIKKEE